MDLMHIKKESKRKRIAQLSNLTLFPAAFLYYEILFKLFGNINSGKIIPIFLFAIGTGLLAGAVSLLIRKKVFRFIYTEGVLFILAVIFITEAFVGKAFQTFMAPSSLLTGAGNVAEDFLSVVFTTIFSGWYVILIYLLPMGLIAYYRRKLFWDYRYLSPSIGCVFVLSILFFITGHLTALGQPVYTNEYQFDSSVRNMGVFTTFSVELRHSIFGGNKNDEFVVVNDSEEELIEKEPEIIYEENILDIDFNALASSASETAVANLDTYLDAQNGSKQNEYTGLFEGKNLILITAEAFSPYAVSEELTPTLYRMMHKGFYFSDYYQPAWGGSTSTGEYSVLMGLIPTNGVKSIRKTEGHNLYMTIGNQLSRLGYYSAAYHNNSYTYYSRNTTHPNFGYSTYTAMGNGMEAGVTNCWPQSDLEMIDFSVPQYIDNQPFSIYYMTVSGHCAYSYDGNAMSKKNWEAVQELPYSDTIKGYIASQLELEYAMTSLVSQLEAADILDDTVICLTSDHYPYGLEAGDTWGNDMNYLPELYGCSEADLSSKLVQDKNSLIIWSGCLENELSDYATEIDVPTYSLDILPTLSNLFGVEYDSRLLVGRDVFSDADALVIWSDYSFKTEYAFYNASTGILTPAGEDVSDSYVERIKAMVQNKFNLSEVTLEYDYWRHVFGD